MFFLSVSALKDYEQREMKLGRKLCKPLGFSPFEINESIPIVRKTMILERKLKFGRG